MEKTSDFHSSWKYEVGWLAEAETKAYTDWKPCGLPETCEADLLNHETVADLTHTNIPLLQMGGAI